MKKLIRATSLSCLFLGTALVFCPTPHSTQSNKAALHIADSSTDHVAAQLVQQPATNKKRRLDVESTPTNANQRTYYTVLQSFRKAIGNNWMATVRILADNRQVAMGAVIHPDGWVITKASEIPEGGLTCRLYDGTRSEALVKAQRTDLDLALLKLDRKELVCVDWSADVSSRVGSWLATTDLKSMPMAIGVLSVGPRQISSVKAVLGIQLDARDEAPVVSMVLPGSGAFEAGLQAEDIVVKIDEQAVFSRQAVLDILGSFKAGQHVDVTVKRGTEEVELHAKLMDLSNSLFDPTEMEVNGQISSRSTGFPKVIQHDTVISPNQCGGPLVDLYGHAVGINIARAGRVCSYALPADIVVPAIQDMLNTATDGKVIFASANQSADSTKAPEEIVIRAQDSGVIPAVK
jgi:serine protease Do